MGNNASKPAEESAPIEAQEVLDQDLPNYDDQLDYASSDTNSIRDDWSHDGNYDRIIDVGSSFDRHEEAIFAQQVDQMHAHNDTIASAFADELRWVEDNGRDILAAWLSASKIYRDAFASRAPESFEATADLIEDEWRAVVKRESCLPVEDVADLNYKLSDPSYITDRLLNQGLHQQLIPLFVDYLRLGFDYQDLLLEFTDELAVHGGDLEATKEYLESIFDPCDPYHRIYWAVPWFRNNDDGCYPHVKVASPSGQLRSPERGAFSALSNTLPNAPGFETSPTQVSPAESFIRFPSASPGLPPSPFTPRNDNNFIIRNMCKDFRWLAKRGWPPQASWKFVTAMVRTRISSSGDDIGRAIDSVYGTMHLYTDSRLVKLEIHQWRDLALLIELRPTLEELPTDELRDRMTKIVEDAMARDFDFYWTIEQWHLAFRDNSISRRQSVRALSDVRKGLENFHEFILEQNAEEILREWAPRLFHCLDRDSDDEDDDPPARSPHPTFEEVMNGLFDAPDSDQDEFVDGGSDHNGSDHDGSDHDGSDHDGSGYGGFGHDSSEPEDEDTDDPEMSSSESEPSSTEEADIVSDDISTGSTEEGSRYSPRLEGDENDSGEEEIVVGSPRAPPSSPPAPLRSSPLTSLWNAINPDQPLSSSRASQATATTYYTARNSPYNSSPPARQWSSSPPRLPSTPRLLPTSPNYAPTPSPMEHLPTRNASSPLSSYYTAFSTPPNRLHSTPPPFSPPIPSTPRASDIQGPTSPPFAQTFDTLVRSSPPTSNRRRPTPRHRDRRIQRVDNLRYENRLEEPRRLPNTPTASHLPPRPRDRTRTPASRACPTCGRRWRDRSRSRSKRKSKSPSPAAAPAAERTNEGRVKKTPPPTKQQRKKKVKKTPTSSQPAADSEPRYPTRKRKAPSRYEG